MEEIDMQENSTFSQDMESALQDSGLPADLREVVGRTFLFGCDHGSHRTILAGQIVSLEFNEGTGLVLYVNCPAFWGMKLIYLINGRSGWSVLVEEENLAKKDRTDEEWEKMSDEEIDKEAMDEVESRFFKGELVLI